MKQDGKSIARKIGLFIKIFLIVLFNLLLIGILVFYFTYGKDIKKAYDQARVVVAKSTVDTFRQNETSVVYDSKNKPMYTLKGEKEVYYLNIDEIPKYASKAIIAIEDKNFLNHNGFDIKGIARAVLKLVKNKGEITQGGSTITQQLARNIFLTHERSYERKVKEIFIAMELEKKYSKRQILEFYLNNIYFANGYYGIEAAAKGYFSKSSKDLSLSQLAFLCSIPNGPNLYNPITNKENTLKRRDRILDEMQEMEYITLAECNQAKNEQIKLKPKKKRNISQIETYINTSAVKALMSARGFTFKYYFDNDKEKDEYNKLYEDFYDSCHHLLFNSGYKIYTSIDKNKMKELHRAIDSNLSGYTAKSKNGIYLLQAAGTCIDNKTGLVVATVGGRSQDFDVYNLDRSFQSYRQPGSSIKPLIVYTPAFMQGYNPSSKVIDKKEKDGPQNATMTYRGQTTIRVAVEQSLNTVAWKLFEEITPTRGIEFLKKMNFAKISKNDYYLPTSLGGMTYGTNTLEMASAYATLANDGIFRNPSCIKSIKNAEDEYVYKYNPEKISVYSKNSSRMMTDVLKGVLKTGTAYNFGLSNMDSAGKTGTTNNNRDLWMCGYTPYYSTAIWMGYDTPNNLEYAANHRTNVKIWYDFMQSIHKNLEKREFIPYEKANDEVVIENVEDDNTNENSETEEKVSDDSNKDTDKKDEKPKNEKPKEENSEDVPVNNSNENISVPETEPSNQGNEPIEIPEEEFDSFDDSSDNNFDEEITDETDDFIVEEDGGE